MDTMLGKLFLGFWTVMIFASILWYGFLLFYVGYLGAKDIIAMAGRFSGRGEEEAETPGDR